MWLNGAMMAARRRAVVLVGHGAVARDCPREWVTRLKALEARRRATREPMSAEERDLDTRVRRWPRTPENDAYATGLAALAAQVRRRLGETLFAVAYNEFCAPTIQEAVENLVAAGAHEVLVVPSMLTPGGVHSELEIPEILQQLRARHAEVTIRYAWPFDLEQVAAMLVAHLDRFD
jgi:sirohydrochlorin cobaltochelatase